MEGEKRGGERGGGGSPYVGTRLVQILLGLLYMSHVYIDNYMCIHVYGVCIQFRGMDFLVPVPGNPLFSCVCVWLFSFTREKVPFLFLGVSVSVSTLSLYVSPIPTMYMYKMYIHNQAKPS